MKNTSIFKNDTISLTEVRGKYWLYDTTRGMNLAMNAVSEREAFIEALTYYQERLLTVESSFKLLNDKVNTFITNVSFDEVKL